MHPVSPLSQVPIRPCQTYLRVSSAILFSLLPLSYPLKYGLLTSWVLRILLHCADAQYSGKSETAGVGKYISTARRMAGKDAWRQRCNPTRSRNTIPIINQYLPLSTYYLLFGEDLLWLIKDLGSKPARHASY